MKKRPILALFVILLAIFAVYIAKNPTGVQVADTTKRPVETKLYSSNKYGLSFNYPAGYYLEEKDVNTAERLHHQIILTEDTEENRLVREGQAPGREGPVAITIDIYQNNLDKMSAMGFITGTGDSNYKLGNGTISTTTKGTITGFEYEWSGLYEAKSLVVALPSYIYMFSVTRINPDDRIVADFEGILQTATITGGVTAR
jgi:hypothetical protein